jgi:DNA-binding LacI/PurR family transcriptional regulator
MICENTDNSKKAKRLPAYQRVEEDIRARVRDGRLPKGTMLAGRHNLAREYGVALSTAQQAVANLIADGTLETFDRRGTFVAHTHPHPAAEPVAARTTATLGIVATARIDHAATPDVGSLWARLAIRSLEQVFSAAGGVTHFFERYPENRGPYPSGLDDANAISISDAIHALRSEGADAIAVVGLCDARDMSDEVVSAIDVERVPTVYLSWHEIPPPLAQVFYDNRFAGYQAAQHLLRSGCHRLVVLAPFADAWLAERIDGAHNAVRHAGLSRDTLRVFPSERPQQVYDRECSEAIVSELARSLFAGLAAHETPGIIAPNDDMAYAVLSAAFEAGKVAGRDFGLIGFDDDARSCSLGLSTVRPPVEAMGEEAGRLLLRTMHGQKQGLQVRLRSHLIPRASTLMRPISLREGRT